MLSFICVTPSLNSQALACHPMTVKHSSLDAVTSPFSFYFLTPCVLIVTEALESNPSLPLIPPPFCLSPVWSVLFSLLLPVLFYYSTSLSPVKHTQHTHTFVDTDTDDLSYFSLHRCAIPQLSQYFLYMKMCAMDACKGETTDNTCTFPRFFDIGLSFLPQKTVMDL